MLADEGAAVHAHDFALRESFAQGLGRGLVEVGLGIGRAEDGLVHNEVVCVGRRQALSLLVEDGAGQGHSDEAEGFAPLRAQGLQLLLHGAERFEVLVGRVVAAHVDNRVLRAEPRQRVDVRVGVVAREVAVAEPEEVVHAEPVGEQRLDRLLRGLGAAAVRVEQAFGRCQQRAVAVGLDAAALELKVEAVHVFPL